MSYLKGIIVEDILVPHNAPKLGFKILIYVVICKKALFSCFFVVLLVLDENKCYRYISCVTFWSFCDFKIFLISQFCECGLLTVVYTIQGACGTPSPLQNLTLTCSKWWKMGLVGTSQFWKVLYWDNSFVQTLIFILPKNKSPLKKMKK